MAIKRGLVLLKRITFQDGFDLFAGGEAVSARIKSGATSLGNARKKRAGKSDRYALSSFERRIDAKAASRFDPILSPLMERDKEEHAVDLTGALAQHSLAWTCVLAGFEERNGNEHAC